MLALFLAGYIAMTLIWEDFAAYDDSQFTAYTLREIYLPIKVWPEGGRFAPLGLQEFNLIGHFTKTIVGYHVLPIVEVLVFVSVLMILDDQLSVAGRAVLAGLALITPSAVVSFTGLTYPERNVLLLLACLALFVKRFEQTRSAGWAVAAVVCSQVMLYLKEPVFLLLLSFAAARLILRRRNAANSGCNRLDLCIGALSLVFVPFYAIMMFPYTSAQYLAPNRVSLTGAAGFYVEADLLVWIFAAAVAVRMYRIFRGKATPLLLWDGLACVGLVYFGTYLALRLVSPYYLAPVDLIAVLYLGHLLFVSWGAMRLRVRTAAAMLVAIVVCQNLALSTFQVLERKFFIHQKAAIASMILERYQRAPGSVQKLYFPFTGPYVLFEFPSYLSYRGVPLEEAGAGSLGDARVRIFGAKIARDGRCVPWQSFVCHAGAAGPGSLAIVLPDDPVSPAEWKTYREKLSEDDPRTQPPRWLIRSLVRMWNWGWK